MLHITHVALGNLKDKLNEIVTPYGNLNRIKAIQGSLTVQLDARCKAICQSVSLALH